MAAPFSSVSPMSSSPFEEAALAERVHLEGDHLPVREGDGLRREVHAQARVLPALGVPHAQVALGLGSTTGRMPFLKQLLKKMSAKEVEITQRMPKSASAQGACSRDDPQPKLSPATRIWASR
jgi:hypothetical protein